MLLGDSGRDPCTFNRGARMDTTTDHLERLKEVAAFEIIHINKIRI
jgi:hypothetical protein